MILTQKALSQISNINTRLRLAMALKVTEQAIIRYIDVNSERLQLPQSLAIVREVTGMADSEILVDEDATHEVA